MGNRAAQEIRRGNKVRVQHHHKLGLDQRHPMSHRARFISRALQAANMLNIEAFCGEFSHFCSRNFDWFRQSSRPTPAPLAVHADNP